jgi:hypothetical protein
MALADGDPHQALDLAAEAVEHTARSRDWWVRGYALGSLSAALAALGRLEQAREHAETGLALMLEIDNQWGVALSRIGLGDLARAAGDLDAARRHYAAALPFAREYMSAAQAARCLTCIAVIAIRQGDLGPARSCLTESLGLTTAAAHHSGTARALAASAALALAERRPDLAVTLAAAETALRATARLSPRPSRRQHYRDRTALGDAEFSRLWAAGLRLTSSEAAALATQPPATTAAGRP